MTHKHDAGSEAALINEAINKLPLERLRDAVNKTQSALYKIANPTNSLSLSFKDAIALDSVLKELYGETPFLNLHIQALDGISSLAPWGREDSGLRLGGLVGDLQRLIADNNEDGVLDDAEREEEIEHCGKLIRKTQSLQNRLIAGRPNPKAANDTNP
ncbi:MAG: hypothetical protein ABJN40_13360 [Sneathiella sp.]